MKLRKCRTAYAVLVLALAASGCTAGGDPATGPGSSPDDSASSSLPGDPIEALATPSGPLGGKGSKKPIATKRASLGDPPGDAQIAGEVPGYLDILGGVVEGAGPDGLRLILRMSGPVPETMPDDRTHLIIAWNLTGSKKATGAGFSAQAGSAGWVVSAAQGPDTVDFTGALAIDGNDVILTVPWSFIGGARRFEWSAAASWFSSSEDGTSSSSSADNITQGRYP